MEINGFDYNKLKDCRWDTKYSLEFALKLVSEVGYPDNVVTRADKINYIFTNLAPKVAKNVIKRSHELYEYIKSEGE